MRFLKTYRIPFLLIIGLYFFHLFAKDYSSKDEKPIVGDAQAYYAYLPAIFIYHDLSYEFLAEINQKYYTESNTKSFLNQVGDQKVNKTFPGVAVLYAPFFFLAHAIALATNLEADGYSFIYQFCFDLALWFYLLVGLIAMQQILRRLNLKNQIVELSTVFIVLATNIFFYSFYDQSVTHIYNFFLINSLVLLCLNQYQNPTKKRLVLIGSLLALIGITRPTNVLAFGVLLLLIPHIKFYKTLFKPRSLALIALGAIPLLYIPFALWKAQTDQWIVYSYGEEGFNFANPAWYNFLFSALKGWFVYTPLAFLMLVLGLVYLFKNDQKRFYGCILFYAASTYVFSAWWCWYYGAGMGQRVMIDHYLILGFLMASAFQMVWHNKKLRTILISACVLLTGLNVAQAYQIKHGILPNGTPSRAAYFDNFLSFKKRATVYPYVHWEVKNQRHLSLEPNSPEIVKGKTDYIEGEWMTQVTQHEPYSASFTLPPLDVKKGSHLVLSFQARARTKVKNSRLVYEYNTTYGTFYLDTYLKKDNWIPIDVLIEPNQPIKTPLKFYFWNGNTAEKVEIKQLKFTHYFSDGYF